MNRRDFLNALWKTVAAVPFAAIAARVLPTRVTEALRTRRYPGPVRQLRAGELRQRGKWAG